MPRVNLLPFFVVLVLVLGFVRGFAAETNAATELVTALAKLQATSNRKRDQMDGVNAKARLNASGTSNGLICHRGAEARRTDPILGLRRFLLLNYSFLNSEFLLPICSDLRASV